MTHLTTKPQPGLMLTSPYAPFPVCDVKSYMLAEMSRNSLKVLIRIAYVIQTCIMQIVTGVAISPDLKERVE